MGLGLKLKELRQARGLSQEQLGELIGCSQVYVSQLERAQEEKTPGRAIANAIERVTRAWGTPISAEDWDVETERARVAS